MKLQVRLFAQARDLAGAEQVEIEVPDSADVNALRRALGERFPELRAIVAHLLVAIGTDYADGSVSLKATDEIACFPPVSGG